MQTLHYLLSSQLQVSIEEENTHTHSLTQTQNKTPYTQPPHPHTHRHTHTRTHTHTHTHTAPTSGVAGVDDDNGTRLTVGLCFIDGTLHLRHVQCPVVLFFQVIANLCSDGGGNAQDIPNQISITAPLLRHHMDLLSLLRINTHRSL